MQRGLVLLDRPDLSTIDGIVHDGARLGGGELTALVTSQRRESGQDDLIRALTPGGTEHQDEITGTGEWAATWRPARCD